jgi:amino acid permease
MHAQAQGGDGERDGEGDARLQKTLKPRHMMMISLGGVIGAGLFVGSGAVIKQTARRPCSPTCSPVCSSCS